MRHHLAAPFALFAVAFLLAPAHAGHVKRDDAPDAASLLWSRARLSNDDAPQSVSQRDFAVYAAGAWSPLGVLRDWRDTLRASGVHARRDFAPSLFGRRVGLSLGAVDVPDLAGVAGGVAASVKLGVWEVGSTLPSKDLNAALESFDALNGQQSAGQQSAPSNEQRLWWLRARPHVAEGELELDFARGSASAGNSPQLDGMFYGARGRLQLPSRWNLTGEWASAQLSGKTRKARWKARFDGPISHPLGTSRVELEMRETDAGYADFANVNASGARETRLNVTQNLQIGALSGNVSASASTQSPDAATPPGNPAQTLESGSRGQLKWNLTSSLALRADGDLRQTQTQRAGENGTRLGDEQSAQRGDVGVEWRAGRLSLAATVGSSTASSRQQENAAVGARWLNGPESSESRLGLEVRQESGGSRFAASFAARDRDDLSSQASLQWQRLATLHLEAERRVIGSLRLRTAWDFARDRDAAWSDDSALARRIEAEMSFSRAARFGVRLRDGAALPGAWQSDALAQPFGGFQAGNREFAAHFEAGNSERGMGMSLEYARQRQARDEQWRVGVTYR